MVWHLALELRPQVVGCSNSLRCLEIGRLRDPKP